MKHLKNKEKERRRKQSHKSYWENTKDKVFSNFINTDKVVKTK